MKKHIFRIIFTVYILSYTFNAYAWIGGSTPKLHVEGRYLKDYHNNTVNMHGVAITPSPWFNGCGNGNCRWENYDINGCLNYNNSVVDRLTDTNAGWYLNYIRLHIDPYWTNTPGMQVTGESDISAFDFERLKTAVDNVIVTMINHAKSRGINALSLSKLTTYKTNINLLTGSTQSITINAVYEDGHTGDVTFSATYTNSNPAVLSIKYGLLIAKANGNATVMISYQGGMDDAKTLILNVHSTYFPLTNNLFNPSIYATGTFDETTGTLVTGQWGFGGWSYNSGIDL